ncbi:hypothetical protein CHS0354_035209 [Potamilus streckersoni]|uniref:Biotin carboxyl carrier protein of acetyl-CoA carboxylase n=1 Tax=Potamilus streckersoni TaxID=2493646 RepID=A0AAE0VN88_9BIVA|nr:hypothetical protein CHS0354_035209 [Potamilus streckersoni]
MNTEKIKQLFELVNNSDITEFNYEEGESKIAIKRGPGQPTQVITHMPASYAPPPQPVYGQYQTHVPVYPASVPAEGLTAPVQAPAADAANIHTVTSPLVGTLYRSSSPEAEPYVKVGSKVNKGDTLCIVEAMKLLNEIEADASGEVVEILVENANPVEYGTPLFKIKT